MRRKTYQLIDKIQYPSKNSLKHKIKESTYLPRLQKCFNTYGMSILGITCLITKMDNSKYVKSEINGP